MNDRVEPTPFTYTDLFEIELQPWEQAHINYEKVLATAQVGMFWTLRTDGVILAIVGFVELWQGVYEVIVYPSVHTHKRPVDYVFRIRRYLNAIARGFHMRRQQTVSLADEPTDRWMRALGFQLEGTLKAYTIEGRDCRLWARFPKWQ